MRLLLLTCILSVFSLFSAAPGQTDKDVSSEISAQGSILSDPPFKIGDTIIYSIDVEWQGDRDFYTVMQPQNPQLEGLELIRRRTSNRVESRDSALYAKTRFEFILQAKEAGTCRISESTIYYQSVADSTPNPLAVYPVKAEILEKPREFPWKKVLSGLALTILVIAAIFFILIKRHRIKRKNAAEDKRSELAKALDELRRNEENRISGEYHAYYSGIMRILYRFVNKLSKGPDQIPQDLKKGFSEIAKSMEPSAGRELTGIADELEELRFSGAGDQGDRGTIINKKVTEYIEKTNKTMGTNRNSKSQTSI
ncbi:MAG: hypothetical protein ABIA63_03250 [bacterium]